MDTCQWVRPKRLGDDAARGAPPAKQAKDIKRDTCNRDGPMRPGNDAALRVLLVEMNLGDVTWFRCRGGVGAAEDAR